MNRGMPVFAHMRKRAMFFNMGAKEWLRTVAVMAVAAACALALGGWTHEVERPLSALDAQQAATDYRTCLAAVKRAAFLEESGDPSRLSDADRAAAARAEELGITADMSEEDALALAPTTETAVEPVVPDVPRWFLVFGGPTLLAMILQMELWPGTCIANEAARNAAFARSVREFASRPRRYLEGAHR